MHLVVFIERELEVPGSGRSCQGPLLLEAVLAEAVRHYALALDGEVRYLSLESSDPVTQESEVVDRILGMVPPVGSVEIHGDRRRSLSLAAALTARGLPVTTPTSDLTVADQIAWCRARTGSGDAPA